MSCNCLINHRWGIANAWSTKTEQLQLQVLSWRFAKKMIFMATLTAATSMSDRLIASAPQSCLRLSAARAVATSGSTFVAATAAAVYNRAMLTTMRAIVFNRGNNHNCDLYDFVDVVTAWSHQWSRRIAHIGDQR